MKKILLIGCSNLLGLHHAFRQVFQQTQTAHQLVLDNKNTRSPDETLLDDHAKYTNLSQAGAGNTYIRHRLFEHLEQETPDYVYLQFSGLNRRDLCFNIENESLFKQFIGDTESYKITPKNIFMHGGRWLTQPKEEKWINERFLLMYTPENSNANNNISLQEVFTCISLLNHKKIKFNWSFFYDPTDAPTQATVEEGTIESFPKWIDQQHRIPSPLNWILDRKGECTDGVHFLYKDYVDFLQHHKGKMHLNFA